MAVETTYSSLRQNLAETLDQVADDQEVVIVRRRTKGGVSRDVALIPAQELGSASPSRCGMNWQGHGQGALRRSTVWSTA